MIRMTGVRRLSFVALLMALLPPGSAVAQRGQDAGLVGTVHDATGAVLNGVTVTASSPQLIGHPQVTKTHPAGTYRFPFLVSFVYEVSTEKDGFQRATRSDITLLRPHLHG